MKKLEGLQWHMRAAEHLGCVKGCLDFLDIDISFPWLYGGTGHAFVINIQQDINVVAPLGWDTRMLFDLAPNLGYTVDRLHMDHFDALAVSPQAYEEKQREAWDRVRAWIDRGLPCYAWELGWIPGYYVINGYDDTGYYCSGYTSGGPVEWQKLGKFDVQSIQVFFIQPGQRAPDTAVVKDALTAVLQRVEQPDGWTIAADFRSGLAAYDWWAEGLVSSRASRDSHTYNTQTWRECREMAVAFLREAKQRLPGRCDAAFDDAAGYYAEVHAKLEQVLALHPYREPANWAETINSPEAAALVREAGEIERKGVACLKRIAGAL